jgi:hypothetical protein
VAEAVTAAGRGRTRLVAGASVAWGAVQLAAPERVVGAVQGSSPPALVWAARVLGARLVVQNAVVLGWPARTAVLAGAAVDALHALSMVPAAVVWPEYRRPALVSGGLAAASAVLGLATAPRSR